MRATKGLYGDSSTVTFIPPTWMCPLLYIFALVSKYHLFQSIFYSYFSESNIALKLDIKTCQCFVQPSCRPQAATFHSFGCFFWYFSIFRIRYRQVESNQVQKSLAFFCRQACHFPIHLYLHSELNPLCYCGEELTVSVNTMLHRAKNLS